MERQVYTASYEIDGEYSKAGTSVRWEGGKFSTRMRRGHYEAHPKGQVDVAWGLLAVPLIFGFIRISRRAAETLK